MFIHYRSKGLVLKKVDRGEADQLFTIYTQDFGKIDILARGVRKISSKLKAGIDVLYLSDVRFIQGKNYKTLVDASVIEKFKTLREDIHKTKAALLVLEKIDELIPSQEKEEKIWNLLSSVFKELNRKKMKIINLNLLYHYFLWNLLKALGYAPQLHNCVLCRKKIRPEVIYFSSKEGGLICPICFTESAKKAKYVTSGVVKILRLILEEKKKMLFSLKVEAKHIKLLNEIMNDSLLWIGIVQ